MVIYRISNLISGKCYIGKATNFTRRIREHKRLLRIGRHYNRHLQASWKKYGEDAFEIVAIERILSGNQDELNFAERKWIKHFNSNNEDFGYNLTSGGEGTPDRVVLEKTRKMMSERMSGERHPQYGARGPLSHNFGRMPSPECMEKARLLHLGNKYRAGKLHTEETREKIRKANTGKKQSSEQIEKRCVSIRKKFLNLLTGEIYPSVAIAAQAVGTTRKHFSKWFRNPAKNQNILIRVKG